MTARPMLHLTAMALLLSGCVASTSVSTSTEDVPMTDTMTTTITVSSSAFAEGGMIPPKYSCDREDVSPPLEWSGAPEGTAAWALIVDDPDARGFVHWAVADIPADTTSLAEGAASGTEGRTSFGGPGYGGPCPPSGSHRYVFTLYALSEPTGLAPGFSADELRAAMEGTILGSGQLSASYRRGG